MRSSLRPVLLVALLGTAAAVPAFAQPGAAGAAGAAGAPDASLSTYAACGAKPSQADTDAAHGAYMAGKGSFDEADYTTAINYFKDAYRRDCTKNELLVIIARAYELRGDRREAVHALETYLERVPAAPDADVQRRHIANLKKEIADQAAASASASASASAVPVATASASAAPTATASASAVPVNEPPATAPQGGHTVAPWIVVGVGGAALITGGILYAVGSGDVSNAEKTCGSSHTASTCTASDASTGNSGRSLESVGVVAGSVGLAAVAGGLIWHFLEPGSSATQMGQTGKPFVAPQLAPGYAGAFVGGRF